MKKLRGLRWRSRFSVSRKAAEHFAPVLETILDEPTFVLKHNDLDLVPGARTTAMLPLSGFIDLFGDLVEAGDYTIASYRRRNREREFGINEALFEHWLEVGCLEE